MRTVAQNNLLLYDDIALIELHNDRYAVIDLENTPLVEGYHWRVVTLGGSKGVEGHPAVAATGPNGLVLLRRLLAGATDRGVRVRQRNGDWLDHRAANLLKIDLRVGGENPQSHSGYIGVYPEPKRNLWRARVTKTLKGEKTMSQRFFPRDDEGLSAALEWVAQERSLHRIGLPN